MPDNNFDPLIRKRRLLELIPIDESTLFNWIKAGRFPQPVVLNAGEKREIVAWREFDYLAWAASLPQRMAARITDKAYERAGRPRKNGQPQ